VTLGIVSAIGASPQWRLAAIPALLFAALAARGCWHAAGALVLADEVVTRALLDARAIPLGAAATTIAARVGPPNDRFGPPTRRWRDRPARVGAAATLPQTATPARHAS
jgi:hypothetical protein